MPLKSVFLFTFKLVLLTQYVFFLSVHIYSSFHMYPLLRFCKRAVLCLVIAMVHYILSHREWRKSGTEMSSVDATINKNRKADYDVMITFVFRTAFKHP